MAKKSSLPKIIINYCNIIKQKYSFKVAIIYIDRETALKGNFKEYIAEQEITLKILPPYTQSQNGSVEYSKGVIIEKF